VDAALVAVEGIRIHVAAGVRLDGVECAPEPGLVGVVVRSVDPLRGDDQVELGRAMGEGAGVRGHASRCIAVVLEHDGRERRRA
jgi:hypothetical protein